ncbi:MAG: epoxyqueuosine reductase QueH, partial [Lentisphaeria bacterium]|nr:epoxyqueuosine reductase QueH [Lentisphaeria bacterium]
MATEQKKLLLHTCCGPCASGCTGLLQENGRDFVLYFSNSNLCDEAEYEKRLAAARQLAESLGVELIADPYDHT